MSEIPHGGSSIGNHRPTIVRWHLVVILMAFAGLNHFHRQSLPAVIDSVMRDCRLTEFQMGSIFSAFLLGYVLFMIPGGWLADRRGGWFALVVSGFGTAALVAATGACGYDAYTGLAFASLIVVRFLFGALTAPLFPAAGRVVNAWIPFATRGWANGLVLGATTIGVSAAPILFGKLSDHLGWRGACVLMGVITALMTCAWAVYGRNSPAEHPATNEAERAMVAKGGETRLRPAGNADFARLIRNRNLLILTAIYAVVGYYEYTLFYWMKYYFSQVRNYDEVSSRYFTSIVASALIVAMPAGGMLSDWLVRRWGYRAGRAAAPIIGMLASAVLLYIAPRMQDQFEVVALFFLAHAAIGLCEAPIWVAGLEIGAASGGTSAAIVNTGGNLGGMLAPVVTILVVETYRDWNAGFLVASLACVGGALLWLGIRLETPIHPHAELTERTI